jgi:hypothetical protein
MLRGLSDHDAGLFLGRNDRTGLQRSVPRKCCCLWILLNDTRSIELRDASEERFPVPVRSK